MKVKIVNCAENFYWYKNLVGETLDVVQCPRDCNDWYCEGASGSLLKSDCEIINEQKENNMKQEKRPHKWANELRAYAEGCIIQSKPVGYGEWTVNNNPNWGDVGMEFRVKPKPEFPKTYLTGAFLTDVWQDSDDSCEEAHVRVANYVLQHFVESGQMDAYIKERDNAEN